MPQVNPENLRWARETAGLSPEDAAHALGLSRKGGVERLSQIEAGKREPTRTQLVNMAKKYRRPLLALYLDGPPAPGARNRDLRRMPDPDETKEAWLHTMIRDAYVRQAMLTSALEDEEEAQPLPFVGSAPQDSNAAELVHRIERALNLRIEDYRNTRTASEAFDLLRSKVEQLGAFVLLMGNLGNYRTSLTPRVFRGFSIAKSVAPFIVINDTDSKAAWSFTLIHELAHIFLGQSDISGYGSNDAVEHLCDDVASQFLLRPDDLNGLNVTERTTFKALLDLLDGLARSLKVSRKMLAYNLWRSHRIQGQMYERLEDRFDQDREEYEHRREGEGGADYYVVRRHRLGIGLIRTVDRMMIAGALTAPKAAQVLGVKPANVSRLVSEVGAP